MLESLTRIVQSLTPGQLQEAALIFLTLRGFRHPEPCDGWNDGGTDLRVFQCEEVSGRLVVQTSVERRWKSKLEADLKKSCKNYEVYSYLYITTRKISELEWQQLYARLKKETNVAIERADAQSLASTFWEAGRTSDLLAIVGIDQRILKDGGPTETSFLSEACFGYTFSVRRF